MKMEILQKAIRWRIDALRQRINAMSFNFRTLKFLIWYKHIIGSVEGAEGIKVRQPVRVLGPGKVIIGKNVRFGYELSPSWKKREILILTKFKESELIIGERSTINNNNSFVIVRRIEFGYRVNTGHDCQFYDSEMHSIDPVKRHQGGDKGGRQGDVIINTNVMIGAQVTIGPGTEVGENSIIGLRSCTRWKKFPSEHVIVGNPARAVMKITDLLSAK